MEGRTFPSVGEDFVPEEGVSSDSEDEENVPTPEVATDPSEAKAPLVVAATEKQRLVVPETVSPTSHSSINADENGTSSWGSTKLPAKRGLSALRLALIGYFLTCGGPYGTESSVGAAGVYLYCCLVNINFSLLRTIG